jgi:hypothetical protein
MRKILLWMATMWVGMITIVVIVSMMIGVSSSSGAFFGSLVLWLFALAGGVALSAPAFLNPPEDSGGVWWFALPLPLWLFLMVLKLASWMGFYILLGTWMLIFKFWNNHQNNQLPTFDAAPQQYAAQPSGSQPYAPQPYAPQPYAPQPYAPQPYGSQPYGSQPYGSPGYAQQPYPPQPSTTTPPASWQTDPTGRYQHRWWDGIRWTDRVANGNVQAVDPL